MFMNVVNVLALNNLKASKFLDCIYSIEIDNKDTTDYITSASYLERVLEIDNTRTLAWKI